MSLINQMLKDLEKRNHTAPKIETLYSKTAIAENEVSKKNLFIFAALGILAGAALIASHSLFSSVKFKSAPLSIALPELKDPSLKPANPEQSQIGLSNLTGITMQEQGRNTSLRFLLSKETLYRLDTSKENELRIFLENTSSTTNIPALNTENLALHDLKMQQLNNRTLVLTLKLSENTQLSRFLELEGKLPELQIDLFTPEATRFNTAAQSFAPLLESGYIKKIIVDQPREKQYQLALQALSHHETLQGILKLKKLLEMYPNFHKARKTLAELFVEYNKPKEAEKLLITGLQLQPNYIPFIQLKSRILFEKGNVAKAIQLLERYSPEINQHPDYYATLAAFYQRSGKLFLARNLYEQLLQMDPSKAIWWIGLGIALDSLGQHKDAKIAFAQAKRDTTLNPNLKAFLTSKML